MDIKAQTDSLLQDLGLDAVSEEQKQEVLAKIQEMADMEVLYALMSHLSDEQIERIDQAIADQNLSEAEEGAQMMALIKEQLPNYDEIVAQALVNLYDRIRQDASEVQLFLESHPIQHPETPLQTDDDEEELSQD